MNAPDSQNARHVADSSLQRILQRTTHVAARLMRAPMALAGMTDEDRWILATSGIPEPCPAQYVELLKNLRDSGNPTLDTSVPSSVRALGIQAYVAVPVMDRNGEAKAYVCVLDQQARSWEKDDLQALEELCVGLADAFELVQLAADTDTTQEDVTQGSPTRPGELPFVLVFQAHPLPLTIHDYPQGRYLDANNAWLAQTGFTRDEVIGKTSSELNVFVDPSLRVKLFQQLTEQGYARGLEGDLRMKNGNVRRCLLTSQQVTMGGRVRLLSGIQDITELKRIETELRASEEQMRLITHALPIYILHCDTQFRYKFVNTAYAARLGLAPDQLIGKTIRDILGDQVWEAVKDKVERVIQGEPIEYEALLPYRGLGPRYVRSVSVPELDKDGTVRGLIGVLVDITEQKAMEAERAKLLAHSLEQATQLRAADRHKDEFLAMLAHELRNPLAPINTAAQLLPGLVQKGPQARQVVDIVQRQVKHMTRLVEDLLDISRLTLGKITLRKQIVDVAQAVHAGVELTRPLINDRHHAVSITIPADRLMVSGDPARLAQVVSNLLNNAAKYTEEHGRIAISVEKQDEEAVIRVADNGIGIAPDLLPHVFELFTQAERTLDRSQGGLGIGLALVKNLVTMHGGSVEVHSQGSHTGTEFIVRLPLQIDRVLTQAEGSAACASVTPRRMLVVDDNVDAADSLAMLLRAHGHEVLVAYDAAAALDVTRDKRPDILLVDIGLPGTDGYTLAPKLREIDVSRTITLIAVTGYGLAEDRERSKAAGFNHHLVKPVDIDVLRSLLAQPSS